MSRLVIGLMFFVLLGGIGIQGAWSGNQPVSQGQVNTIAPVFKTVSPEESMKLIKERKDLLLVDVRSPGELSEGKIDGSYLLPFWDIAKGKFDIPKDRPILLICAVGGRSFAVGKFLSSIGYPEVYNLEGGIDNWKKNGLPLTY